MLSNLYGKITYDEYPVIEWIGYYYRTKKFKKFLLYYVTNIHLVFEQITSVSFESLESCMDRAGNKTHPSRPERVGGVGFGGNGAGRVVHLTRPIAITMHGCQDVVSVGIIPYVGFTFDYEFYGLDIAHCVLLLGQINYVINWTFTPYRLKLNNVVILSMWVGIKTLIRAC